MAFEYQLGWQDYIAIFRRHAVQFGAAFLGIFAFAVVISFIIPPIYQSTGTIMIEAPQITADLVPATVTSYADERIEVIKQRVMTRENLMGIIDKYQLYKDTKNLYSPSELIGEMRDRIAVELVNVNLQGRMNPAGGTIAFKVSFESREPELAHRVANELVTLFLDENVKARTERATQTTEFLSQEAEKIKKDLEVLETKIAKYKQQYGLATPENLALVMSTIQRVESELRTVEHDYKVAQEEVRLLELELANVRAGGIVAPGATAPTLSPAQELERTRAEYAKLMSTYTESHPDVVAAKRKIDQLERQLASGGGKAARPAAVSGDITTARLEARISSARGRAASLAQQQSVLRAKLNNLEQQMAKAPEVERGLSSMVRDQESAQKKYEEIRAKQMTAQVAENLEGGRKAERFTLLEPPLLPEKPIKPNRKKLIAMGFVLALIAAGGLIMALESFHGGIRGVEALESVIGYRPMAVIPYITIDSEMERRKELMKKAGVGAAIGLVVLLILIHFVYQPLDVLIMKRLLG